MRKLTRLETHPKSLNSIRSAAQEKLHKHSDTDVQFYIFSIGILHLINFTVGQTDEIIHLEEFGQTQSSSKA